MGKILKSFCKAYEVLPTKRPVLLNFKLNGIYKWIGGTDHTVTLACSNKAVTLTTKKVVIEEGWAFKTFIESSSAGSATLEISVDGVVDSRFRFRFSDSKDVFRKASYDLMMDELKYIAPEVNKSPTHAEYSGNYCMGASERGLSELLGDTSNFYAVERHTHKHKNRISFSGKSAADRGKHFKSLGYTEKDHRFRGWKVIHSKKDLIFNAKDDSDATTQYSAVKYDIIDFTATGKADLNRLFDEDLKDKEIGFHVYYVTVTDGFHTLLLIIDTITDPCNPKYEFWDQHGLTSSHGPLSDIAEGLRRQTSWTFANSCLNRYKTKRTKHYDSTDTYLWKITRK
jgi:hypothetical protein